VIPGRFELTMKALRMLHPEPLDDGTYFILN
jgi:hypothetical protein